ncbi:MAG TPA: diaminopimelate epimerase [Bacteroidales bacterium]|nr:diaminopimelate epimerase [Bacteroidales bacterium]HRZ48995.1 diaminopimelate epimerase [Bacteroidales bacterium]
MEIAFRKYQATGNDFVMIDNRKGGFIPSKEMVLRLCDRRFGIGADGLILLETEGKGALKMRYFNSDGGEATFCGNGGRAFAAFAAALGIRGNPLVFAASDGLHTASLVEAGHPNYFVELAMSDVEVPNPDLINTGSPHHIVKVDKVSEVDVYMEGKKLRHDPRFMPGGCNVNFTEISGNQIRIRTYERGVEQETLSCGTGATATAIFYALHKPDGSHTREIQTQGGLLQVRFKKTGNRFTDIRLSGPAVESFYGNTDVL